jgi:hypothetical protein
MRNALVIHDIHDVVQDEPDEDDAVDMRMVGSNQEHNHWNSGESTWCILHHFHHHDEETLSVVLLFCLDFDWDIDLEEDSE